MDATHPGGTGRRRRLAAAATALAVAVTLVSGPIAEAVPADTPITFDGGGWGHGIGMPQWGAQGMAEHGGYDYDEILSYWYDGTGLNQAAAISPAVPQTVRVGINYVLVGGEAQHRPFLWQDFSPINGPVEVCKPGESQGGDCLTAQPGETWRYRWFPADGMCAVQRWNGSTWVDQYTKQTSTTYACTVSLFWDDQPDTRVSFPGADVGRTFARGHIELRGPVTEQRNLGYQGWTGFHFNVVVDLDEYVYGIAEVPPSWHMEALKAQAVAARTYGAEKARRVGVRSDCGCHLVWDTMDQAYRGWHGNSEGNTQHGHRWRDAVDDTAGEVVVYPAGSTTIAETYYSSSSGGATENVSDMWGSNQATYPYLVSKPDPWSAMFATNPTENTTIRWRHVRTAGEIVTALTSTSSSCSTAPFPGLTELVNIEIVDKHVSGSPRAIRITGVVGGQVTSKTFYHRGVPCNDRTGTWRFRLGLRGHFIHAISGFLAPDRLGGANRFETAVAVSQDAYPGGADVVYLAVGTNYPDALASGPAAVHDQAPILLVNQGSLPDVTKAELQRLAPSVIRVLGGPAAITDAVVSQVQSAVPGAAVSRLAGANRYETAVEISKASFTESTGVVYVATGENFPDALVAAPAAVLNDGPLLLVRPNEVPQVVRDELTRLAPSTIVIVGGTSAVSSAVENTLKGYAASVQRIAAGDRYAQSAAVSKAKFPSDTATVYVAVGTDFPDALAAASAMAANAGPILLVTSTGIPTAVANELNRIRPSRIVILGGPAAVSEAIATQLAQYLG